MGAIDSLTRFFDNLKGAQNTYHASDMTDKQRQRMYDDRAKSLMGQYDDAYGSDSYNYNFKDAQNGFFGENVLFGEPGDTGFRPKVRDDDIFETKAYDFAYGVPSSDYYGGRSPVGDMPGRPGDFYGKVIIRSPKDNDSALNPLEDDSSYVYGAILADGTKLNADEFREFLKINGVSLGHSAGQYVNMWEDRNAAMDTDSIQKKYNDYSDQYQENFFNYLDSHGTNERNSPYYSIPRWDKGSRSWRTW